MHKSFVKSPFTTQQQLIKRVKKAPSLSPSSPSLQSSRSVAPQPPGICVSRFQSSRLIYKFSRNYLFHACSFHLICIRLYYRSQLFPSFSVLNSHSSVKTTRPNQRKFPASRFPYILELGAATHCVALKITEASQTAPNYHLFLERLGFVAFITCFFRIAFMFSF